MPGKQSWFKVQAAADGGAKAPEVAIRGYIGQFGVNDTDFAASVDALGDIKELTVIINSRGGEMDVAIGIYNYLKNHLANVTVRVDGVAMSSGSIIAMAGDTIEMPANTVMMVHNPWSIVSGNAADLRAEADVLDVFEKALRETYMARTGKTEDEIKALLEEETYMTAAKAVELGFADKVLPIGNQNATKAMAIAFASALDIPADVLAEIEAIEQQGEQGGQGGGADAGAGETGQPGEERGQQAASGPTFAAFIQAKCAETDLADYAADIALDMDIANSAQAEAAIRDAREIVDLCALAKKPDMAKALIRKHASLADARNALIEARAVEDEAAHVDNFQPGSSKPPHSEPQAVSTASIWAARKAH